MSCWVCAGDTELFYSVTDIPTSSVVLHRDREKAIAQPRGDLDLHVCLRCGFIQNASFDPLLIDYDAPYEPSQAASPVFREFAERTIDGLADRHDLKGGVVLEVGCGKGEWLAMCCRRAGMSGIGVDPAFTPGQVPEEDSAAFEVLVDYFGPDSDLTGALVACRHTLEHLPDPVEFTRWLVDAARRTPGSVIYLEVPDTTRILGEGAFWDVYYEHCSYFTQDSLAVLAVESGLEMLRLDVGYSDQYLMLEGRPGVSVVPVPDGSRVASHARTFGVRARAAIEGWGERLKTADNVALWAATSKTVGFIEATGIDPECVVDINPAKWGSYLPGSGAEVISPGNLPARDFDVVVAMNPIYLNEIATEMRALGIDRPLIGLGEVADD